MGEPMPPPSVKTYSNYLEYVQGLPCVVSRHMPHRVVYIEEESVSYIQAISSTQSRYCAFLIFFRFTVNYLGSKDLSVHHTDGTSLPLHSWNALMQLCTLQSWCIGEYLKISRLVTLGDYEGMLFNAIQHIINKTAFPHRERADVSTKIWERGSLAYATDPCLNNLDLESFLANITRSGEQLIEGVLMELAPDLLCICTLTCHRWKSERRSLRTSWMESSVTSSSRPATSTTCPLIIAVTDWPTRALYHLCLSTNTRRDHNGCSLQRIHVIW